MPAAPNRAGSETRQSPATARLLEGHDAVLNCVTYYFNVPIMRAALAARVPYSDLGGLYHGSLEQFALHEDFVRAGVPALLGMGSTPGITNVMAGVLAQGLDTVEAVHCRSRMRSTRSSTSSRSSPWFSATGGPGRCRP